MNRFKAGSQEPDIEPEAHARVDVHQHLWPPGLVEALRGRDAPPRLRGWTLELPGQRAGEEDPRDHDPELRARQATAAGLTLALISLSSALGIESLAPDEAAPLLSAYHDGALELPAPYGAWAAAGLVEIDPGALARELDRGFAGLQLPASALADSAGYEGAGPLLALLEQRRRPLLIHPGPAAPAGAGTPAWWPAMVDYVQQMHAAWYAFRVHGRARHPRLSVCFAMLAGLAPLHGERFRARAGQGSKLDEQVFLETSSYGTRAIDATIRVLGVDVLVNGSDRPYAAPLEAQLSPATSAALHRSNPFRLLLPEEVTDAPAPLAGAAVARS
ncbi:MAG: amidohydrolase family protein [Solirubrobacterales bacterium]|nr:amidohydrolase family protein [Solirubrobacterales bacterium]